MALVVLTAMTVLLGAPLGAGAERAALEVWGRDRQWCHETQPRLTYGDDKHGCAADEQDDIRRTPDMAPTAAQ